MSLIRRRQESGHRIKDSNLNLTQVGGTMLNCGTKTTKI